jgi:thiosulfate/3-mercaptopyruvate sulfurtransferase
VDSLSPGHYKGDFSLYSRSGHITGAINLPSSDFVDESGFFRPIDELEMMLEADKNTRTITYCGGGVAASSVAFNLHRAGFKDVAVYMGSLQEWVEEPSNPMTLGDTP